MRFHVTTPCGDAQTKRGLPQMRQHAAAFEADSNDICRSFYIGISGVYCFISWIEMTVSISSLTAPTTLTCLQAKGAMVSCLPARV